MLVRNRFGMVKYVVMTCLFIKYQFVIDNNHIYIYIHSIANNVDSI